MISCIAFPRKISLRGGLLGSTAISCGLAMIFVAGLATPLAADNLTWDSSPGSLGIQSGTGNWAEGPGSNENWQNAGGNNTRFDDGDDVTFGDPGGTATVTLQEDVAPGSITFEAGGYTIDSADPDHQIEVHGTEMEINVAGGSATIEAGISNKGTVTISGPGSLTLSGTNMDDGGAVSGTYAISGGNLVITGSTAAEDVFENNNGTLLIDGGGTVLGTVTNNVGTFTNADGDVEGLTTVEGGDVNATGGTFTGGVQLNNGTMTIQADTSAGGITVATGTLEITGSNILNSDVTMTAGGSVTNIGTVEGDVILSAGDFANGEDLFVNPGDVEGTVTINGATATFSNNLGSTVTGLVTVNDGTLDANGGSFADILVNGGTMSVNANTQANGVTIQSGDIDILGGQDLDATLNIEGGEVENFGTLNGTVTLDDGDPDPATGGTLIGRGGDFDDVIVNDGTFDVEANTQADSVTNAGGEVLIETAATLTTNFNQTGGETRIAGGGVLADSDGVVTISGGELQNNGGGTVSSDVSVSGGTLTASGGAFNNDVTVSGTGTFNVDVSTIVGTTTITRGDIDIAGGATLSTNLVQSGGTTTVNSGGQLDDTDDSVDMSGGMLINQGTVADDIELTGDATLVADGGVFGGDITMLSVDTVFDVNVSTLIGSPITVTEGTVNINGTATLTNNIDLGNGTVNVGAGATLNDAGGTDLDSGTLVNAGTVTEQVTVSDGGSLDIAGGAFTNGVVANGGNILISEDTALDLTNNGSDIVIESGDTLTDDVENNAGTLTSTGTIAGTLQITGGIVTQNEADPGDPVGGVTGAVTVSGTGQLIANSGEFGAGITAQADGDVEIGGPVSGDVTNDGGTVSITGTGVLDGDLTNNDGNAEIQTNGQLDGDLTVNGGSVTTEGTITGNGAGVGAVVITDGTLTTTGGSMIQDTTTVSGGTLQADGGSFGGDGIDAGDGNVVINGAVTGDISIDATADLSVTGTGNLNGDVTMEEDSTVEATNDGVIGGRSLPTVGRSRTTERSADRVRPTASRCRAVTFPTTAVPRSIRQCR